MAGHRGGLIISKVIVCWILEIIVLKDEISAASNGFSEEQSRNEEFKYRILSGGLEGFQLGSNFLGGTRVYLCLYNTKCETE